MTRVFLNVYVSDYDELSAKSRNDRRAVVKQFLKWCVSNDYLTASPRLMEAEALKKEALDDTTIDHYRPAELLALLEGSEGPMRAVIALQGLGGLRLAEALRLDWRDVFGIPGLIEVSKSKSKTRQRRLVEIGAALEQWLAPYRGMEGKLAAQWETVNDYVRAFTALREGVTYDLGPEKKGLKIPSRRNGMRNGFVTYHFAFHQNENKTAAQAGSSPAMIHAHYKGLATKKEAEAWFAAPAQDENVITLTAASMK